MGVAQSSIQGLMGTVGAAAAAIGSAASGKKEQEAKNKEQDIKNKEDLDYSKAELAQAHAQATEAGIKKEEAEKVVGEKQGVYDAAMAKRYGGKGNTKAKIQEAQQQALDDLTAAQRAFSILNTKDIAARAMEAR